MLWQHKKIDEATKQSEKDYQEYRDKANKLIDEFERYKEQYNSELSLINQERLSLRDEIRLLYIFLKNLDGVLGNEITVFDYEIETSKISERVRLELPLDKPDFEKDDFWKNLFLQTGLLFECISYSKNKKLLKEYNIKIEEQKLKYETDIENKTRTIENIKDAMKVAEIYRNIIVMVRDSIKGNIIPKLELVAAFLYADAIREKIAARETLVNIKPFNIAEYEGTRYDIHFQFVKNTFDFYNLSINFFSRKILTDLISDKGITSKQKKEFYNQVDEIKKKIDSLSDERG